MAVPDKHIPYRIVIAAKVFWNFFAPMSDRLPSGIAGVLRLVITSIDSLHMAGIRYALLAGMMWFNMHVHQLDSRKRSKHNRASLRASTTFPWRATGILGSNMETTSRKDGLWDNHILKKKRETDDD